ncbi:MAG: ankyrin repeat domain-containing protein [Lentisphaeraceae bacterium]|nr:ankyrin repeat domain-containing protein [Lentisphaeraceae bacterium]
MLIDEYPEVLNNYILDGVKIADYNRNFELLDYFNTLQTLEPWHLKQIQKRADEEDGREFLAKYNIFIEKKDFSIFKEKPSLTSKEVVDEFIQSGKDINQIYQSGYNYLSKAIGDRKSEVAEYLYSKGAELQPLDSNRESILLFAINSKNNRLFEDALKAKAPPIFKYENHAIFASLTNGTIESFKKLYPLYKGLLTDEFLKKNIQYINFDLEKKIQFLIQEGRRIDDKIVFEEMSLQVLEAISPFIKKFPLDYLMYTLVNDQPLKSAQIWEKCDFNLSSEERHKLILKCLKNESLKSLRFLKSSGFDLSPIREESKKYLSPELWALTGVSCEDFILTKEGIDRLYWRLFIYLENQKLKVPNHLKVPYAVKLCTYKHYILPTTFKSAIKQLSLSQAEIVEVLKTLSNKKKVYHLKYLLNQLQKKHGLGEVSKAFFRNGYLDYALILTPQPSDEFLLLEENVLKSLIANDNYLSFSKVLSKIDLSAELQKSLLVECLQKDNVKFLNLLIQKKKNHQLFANVLNTAMSKKSLDSANILIDQLPKNFVLNLDTPFSVATEEGHLSLVQKLIDRDLNFFEFKSYEALSSIYLYSPPHIAAYKGYLGLVELFVKKRIFAGNIKSKAQIGEGITPLKVAIEQEHSEIVRFLLKNKFSYLRLRLDILETGNKDLYSLIDTKTLNDDEISSLLIGGNNELILDFFSANPSKIHKINILNLESPKLERFLLNHFPKQNKKTKLSLLIEIIEGVDLEVFKGFFNQITLTPKELDHLLLVATMSNNLEVCQFLLKNKASPFRKFLFGATAFKKAINENHFDIVKVISDHYPSVQLNFTKSQITTLINSQPLIYSYFIEKGKIKANEEHLIEAIQDENSFIVTLLVDKVKVSKKAVSEAQNTFPMILPLLKKHRKE